MTIRWAGLEMATDSLVADIFRRLPPKKEEFPRALKRKTQFLRRQFRTSGALNPWSNAGASLADRIDKASEDRQWIIHGVVGDVQEFERSGRVTMRRTAYQKHMVHMDQKIVTVQDIDGYSIQFLALMNELDRFAKSVFHDPDNPLGALVV